MNDLDELFWGGYLKFLFNLGFVTVATGADEIAAIKAEFMSGLRGEPMPCDTTPFRPESVQRVADRTNQKETP